MKRKAILIIGLALFVGVVAFNVQMNLSNNQTSDVTLNNIEALTASAEESGDCITECASGIIFTVVGSVLACDGGCECHWVEGYSSDGSIWGFC